MKLRNRAILLFIILGAASWLGPLFAQSERGRSIQITAFPAGVGRYEPDQWASLGVQAGNTTESDGEALVAVYFGKDPQTQFARRMWVPAKSVRKTWMPVRIPETGDASGKSIEMTLLSLRDSPQGEIIERRPGLELLRSSMLTIDREPVKTAALYRKPLPDQRGAVHDADEDAYEWVAEARKLAGLSRIVMEFSDDFVPSHVAMWDSLDQVILCSDRIVDDSAGLANLRDWLHRGGQLCVFLDRVTADTIAALVGNSISFQVVDRVELDEFTIENTITWDPGRTRDKRRFEQPVELVRVVTDVADIHSRVNGWPAAFRQRVGSGEILFVALGPRGWIPPPIQPGQEKLPENTDVDFRTSGALQYVAERFFQPRAKEVDAKGIVEPMLQEQIGYRIPGRLLAASLLGLNCVGLIAMGWWCSRNHRLERLAWFLPGLAIAVTAMFLSIGRLNSKRVPPTVAFTQLVQVFPSTDQANVSGVAALYHQDSTPLSMSGGSGGIVYTTSQATDAAIRRIVWDDTDRGRWQNVVLPGSSVQFVTFRKPIRLTSPINAVGRFGPRGLEGRVVAGSASTLEDAVIANPPAPSLAVRVNSDGTFGGGKEDLLSAGQFIAQQMLSDVSRRRQDVYRQAVSAGEMSRFPTSPSLLGWSAPLACGLDWPADLQQTGEALLTIPLRFQRTPSGERFFLPATFIQVELASNDSGQSTTYNPRTGRWLQGVSRASRSRLRFRLPAEVLPCQVTNAELTIKINAPSRTLLVYSVVNGQEQLLREVPNPNGLYEVLVNRPEVLPTDVDQGLVFTIAVTEAEDERQMREEHEKAANQTTQPVPGNFAPAPSRLVNSFSTWNIDYVRLNVNGQTL